MRSLFVFLVRIRTRMDMKTLEEFDNLLLKTIDETLKYVLGDINAQIIYRYLEKKSCPMLEIPRKLNIFSAELRMLLGPGRGQILGSAPILEETIAELLCHKLGIKFNEERPIMFESCIRKLKEDYNNGGNKNAHTPITKPMKDVHALKVKGIGMGLAINKKLIAKHKGTVDVKSLEEVNFFFTTEFPLFQQKGGANA